MIRDTFDFAAEAVEQALGDDIVYAGVTVKAVYGAGFTEAENGGVKVSSRKCEVTVRYDALPKPPAEGIPVRVRGLDFKVATVKPDVEDVTATLILKRT